MKSMNLLMKKIDLHSRDGDVHYKPSRSSTDLLLRTLIRDGKGTERVHQLAVRSGKASQVSFVVIVSIEIRNAHWFGLMFSDARPELSSAFQSTATQCMKLCVRRIITTL